MQEGELAQLRELVAHNIALTEETNRLVRKMRRGARWAIIFQILWWLTILGVTGATYYYYVQPYVAKLESAYGQAQATGEQAQSFGTQVENFFNNWGKTPQQ